MGNTYMSDGLLFSEDDFESSGLPFDARYLNKSYVAPSLMPGKEALQFNSYSKTNIVLVCNVSTSGGDLLNASAVGDPSSAVTVLTNPCKDFAFPPPPPGDMRRIGPRRKFIPFYIVFAYLLV